MVLFLVAIFPFLLYTPKYSQIKENYHMSEKNHLNPLGRKIFLDRYALKDTQKRSINVGDEVIVVSNPATGQREIGIAKQIDKDMITVELQDGSTHKASSEHVDKPIETDPLQMIERVSSAIAKQEKKSEQPMWKDRFQWLMEDWRFVPGGRILSGAGTDGNLTYYNCYVVPSPQDSREGIMKTLTNMTEIMSRGGGVGINLSSLRPRNAYVKGVNGRSSGIVSWGGLYSFVTGLIEQGGSRRGALMLILDSWHPDLMDFINSKREMGKITNANISVAVTDDFMKVLRADGVWTFEFPDTSHKAYDSEWDGDLKKWKDLGYPVVAHGAMKASEIWDAIVDSAWASAEPGIFFSDRYNAMSNSSYYNTIRCTNPCGEQGLPPWGVCNLGSLNLAAFVQGTEVMWEDLGKAVRYAIRFLDNVIDDTPYFFQQNKDQQESERRVGLGTMGLAEMLIRTKIRYGSDECSTFLDKLYGFICEEAYLASSDIAKEKGSFPLFDAEKFVQSGFMKTLPKHIVDAVKKQGIRNVTLLTQAPTGTTGTMVGTSTGIEPYYFWEWERVGRMGSHIERVDIYAEWKDQAKDGDPIPPYFVTAMDLTPEDHVRVQASIQKWVDSSISKTCNAPNHYTKEQVNKLYHLMYDLGCKGGTIYRDGSRDEQVLNLTSKEEKKEEPVVPEIKPRTRPTVLHGTTYRKPTPIGTAYITINSDGEHIREPFEVFINVAKVGSDVAADAEGLGRLVSLMLRMASPLDPIQRTEAIIAQLKGIGSGRQMGFGKNRVMSLPDAVGQALEEHIGNERFGHEYPQLPDEEDEIEDRQLSFSFKEQTQADICPVCGNATFMNIEGCKKCVSCGHSEC